MWARGNGGQGQQISEWSALRDYSRKIKGKIMPRKISWDDEQAGQALARAMADMYGLSQEEVLLWYHKAMKAMQGLNQARHAVEGLMKESFVVASYGYEERDRDAYHAHYWDRLKEAVGLTEQFCSACGQWYPPGTHTCLQSVSRRKNLRTP